MGHSQSDKLRTHERILEVAAKRFRERGIQGVSISEIMEEVGITVGGFYNHFSSMGESNIARRASKATAILAALVGASLLARGTSDGSLAEKLLNAVSAELRFAYLSEVVPSQ
ncbi:hypothetical protein AYM40_26280 [Paraburkholderia phytofirmans OLGA172]|uniref:HTH tetR-type domain-containing protein n=1 Tax=Paraburkholderia phytofirmans OLGA172 TaxID=1417228 RepID=A0A160FS08_9BURK|nr:helix-turn-helix domain-containing protein [Paraburkholderia phytofirmans]ANB75819.1 hypothetical protein AYM40_26280 [Paraburkholderia phytofirmans OLGA172]